MANKVQQRKIRPLSHQASAHLYLQLSKLEKAGLSMEHTVSLLTESNDEVAKRAAVTLNGIKRGQPLSKAGKRAGLLTDKDAFLIEVAEAGGVHTAIFRKLAEVYQERALQVKQIKNRLVLPLAVFIGAVFIQNFPDLFLGKISIIEYLFGNLFFIGKLAILVYVLWKLPYWIRHSFLRPLQSSWDSLTISFPYFGDWYVRKNIRDFTQSLGLLLQAGLPIFDAVPKAYLSIENNILRQRFEAIENALQQGSTFSQAFVALEGTPPAIIQLVSTGEHAGDLSGMLLRCANMESEQISLETSMITEWLPRIVYLLIVIWIAYGLIQGGSHTPIPDGF